MKMVEIKLREGYIDSIDSSKVEWIKDDVDKLINEVIIKSEKDLTFTQIKNLVYEKCFSLVSKENLRDKLLRLKEMGVLDCKNKVSNIEVWGKKNDQ